MIYECLLLDYEYIKRNGSQLHVYITRSGVTQ